MAIGTAAAITSMAATAASTGMSISQASKARKAQREAEREAQRITEETKRMMDVNPFEAVAIQKEPYEIMAESIVEGAAREAELLAEADPRYLAGMAGARGQQQQDQLERVRASMSRELQGLEMATAQEESDIRDNLQRFAEDEITGAQQAASQQERIANQATVGAIQGFGKLAGQAASLASLYGRGSAKSRLEAMGDAPESAVSDIMGTFVGQDEITTSGINFGGGGFESIGGENIAITEKRLSPTVIQADIETPTLSPERSSLVNQLGGRAKSINYMNNYIAAQQSGDTAALRRMEREYRRMGVLKPLELLLQTYNQ